MSSNFTNTFLNITVKTNLDNLIYSLTPAPSGFTGPFLSAWGYSARSGCLKSNFIGNICNVNAVYDGATIRNGSPSNGYLYSIGIQNINMSSRLNLGFVLSYYNNGATYGQVTKDGITTFDNINVTNGIHNIYYAKICPYLTNEMNTMLSLYQTMTYSYYGCTYNNVSSNNGLKNIFPPTGLVHPESYMSADPSTVPYDILLNFLQERV